MSCPQPENLLLFYQTGDRSAFNTFAEQCFPWLQKKAVFLLPANTAAKHELAEDFANKILYHLFSSRHGVRWRSGGLSLSSWLEQKLRWMVCDHLRQLNNKMHLDSDLQKTDEEGNLSSIIDSLPDRCTKTPLSHLERNELLDAANKTLFSFSLKTRRLLKLVYGLELSYREAVAESGVSKASISREIARVRRRLAELLASDDLAV
jgi:RNA polymerase sigma factor (sigma-70 family)